MKHIFEALQGTDWPLLQKQKHYLLNANVYDVPELTGLINFLDSLQDAVVKDGMAEEKSVFKKQPKHEPTAVIAIWEKEQARKYMEGERVSKNYKFRIPFNTVGEAHAYIKGVNDAVGWEEPHVEIENKEGSPSGGSSGSDAG